MTAEYRSVQTRMWREDEWFQGLPTDARLLFIYLFTNPSASIAGIYRLPLRTIEFESGVPAERVKELLAQFSTANKAHYDSGVVWVVKMRENQLPGATLSPKVRVRLDKDIAAIPDCPLKTKYLTHYGYPMDTLSIPICTETITDTDTDTDPIVVVVAPAPPELAPAAEPAPTPAAAPAKEAATAAVFRCWQDNMPGTLTAVIADDVGDLIDTYGADAVIRAIGEAARANVRNLRYVSGILKNWAAGNTKRATPTNGNGRGPSKVAQSLASVDAIEAMLAAQGGAH